MGQHNAGHILLDTVGKRYQIAGFQLCQVALAGGEIDVRIGDGSADAGKVVMADGVRFVYEEAQDFSANLSTVPTWWRNFYFGGPVNVSADPDGDGYTTGQEYLMGTCPTWVKGVARATFVVLVIKGAVTLATAWLAFRGFGGL